MTRLVWMACLGLALGLTSGPISSAHAQMGVALGQPLSDSNLETGTVTVRVVDGAPTKPLVGIDVQLVTPDGDARTARTDAEGRATFVKLEPGSRHAAQVVTGEGENMNTTRSDTFGVPSSGGIRLLLSTSPWQGGGGGAGPMAGAGGMPDPRQMSGIARPQSGDALRSVTIRVVQGLMSNNVADHPVHLVAFGADGSVKRLSQRTDVGGRTVFENLDSNTVAYYAMTVLPRQIGDRTVGDRVRSRIVMVPPHVGLRMVLAGAAKAGSAPPVEDLTDIETQLPLGPGEVVVNLIGQTQNVGNVELMEVLDGDPVAIATASKSAGSPSNVRGVVMPAQPRPEIGTGTLGIIASRVTASNTSPITAVELELERIDAPVDGAAPGAAEGAAPAAADGTAPAADGTAPAATGTAPAADAAAPMRQRTSPEGFAVFTGLVPGAQYRLAATMYGTRIAGNPFTMPASGGLSASINLAWDDGSEGVVRFGGVTYKPDAVYYARTKLAGKTFTTAPFQMVPDRGATLRMLVLETLQDTIGFGFHAQGVIDDVYMGFQSQMTIHNYSYAPWDPGPDGFLIPLPAGFLGAQVEDEMMQRVGQDKERGFIWRGAVPPGGAQFTGFFSLPIVEGKLDFDLPLPYGAINSLLLMQKTPGVQINQPSGVQGREWTDPQGKSYQVFSRISIQPKQRMVMSMTGLPQRPAWQRYVTVGVGFFVIALLGWGFAGVYVAHRRERELAEQQVTSARAKLQQRRDKLLDELTAVELEKNKLADKEYDKRKAKLNRQLESVYRELDAERESRRAD